MSYEGVFGGGRDEMKEEIAALGYVSADASANVARHGATFRRARVAKKDGRSNGARTPMSAFPLASAKPAPSQQPHYGVAGGVVGGVPGGVVVRAPVAPATMVPMPGDKLLALPREAEAQRQALADGRFDLDGTRTRAAAGEAARAKKAGDLESAQRALAEAAMLAQARQRVSGVDDGTLATVLAELAAVDAAREEQAGRSLPALRRAAAASCCATTTSPPRCKRWRAQPGSRWTSRREACEDVAEAFGAARCASPTWTCGASAPLARSPGWRVRPASPGRCATAAWRSSRRAARADRGSTRCRAHPPSASVRYRRSSARWARRTRRRR